MKQLKSLNLGYLFSMIIATVIGVLPFSCKDNDDLYEQAYYTLSPELEDNTLTFDKDGGKEVIKLETNRHWKIETSDSWLAVTPSEGVAGKAEITIEALANKYGKREGTIRLILGAINKTIKVVQDGDGDGNVELQGMKLADFLAKYSKDGFPTIEEGVTLELVVISDYEGNNSGSNKNVNVQQGDKGLTLRFAQPQKFAKGTVLSVKPAGLKLSKYKGTLQLDLSTKTDAAKATGKTLLIEPKLITLADIYAFTSTTLKILRQSLQMVLA